MGSSLNFRAPFRIPFVRVPYFSGDRKRDANLEHYPHGLRVCAKSVSLGLGVVIQGVGVWVQVKV